jgi:hypothetical protein
MNAKKSLAADRSTVRDEEERCCTGIDILSFDACAVDIEKTSRESVYSLKATYGQSISIRKYNVT